ncbi:hypothetical protein F11_00910 [Rhodospirillum rubrum F11]|uniref:hypothetical protein n=1 Tax=Rhodospirillum rubrum TaxID=1085 RepID=UPI000229D5B4|nr:hypothetical protein [Rhodospirillum rubrum]AEO46652.1 hypothetical protein F11_00910 [Rhodospirillum rubrum F11]
MTDGLDASKILVDGFTEILFWPLNLDLGPKTTTDALKKAMIKVEDGLKDEEIWQEVKDPLRALDEGSDEEKNKREAYAAFVYFHPFIQKVLFPKTDDPNRLLRQFRRSGITHMTAVFKNLSLTFVVKRCHLYLISETGTALFVLEISTQHLLSLDKVQTILEILRRAYPPFWETDKKAGNIPGNIPREVFWHGPKEDRHQPPLTFEDCWEQVAAKDTRRTPRARHWEEVLGKAFFEHPWMQVTDERIPAMAWISVDQPKEISYGDWVRLAFLDSPGLAKIPYGSGYLTDFEKNHCYDAFWNPKENLTTRYLVSGYGFVSVGDKDSGYFKDAIHQHFRRHYFYMGLIAHLQTAILLSLSDRLSDANELDDQDAQDLQKSTLDFTHRLWFPEISNHVQGRALFALWRRHLGTNRLYEQVMREAQEHNAFLNVQADRKAAEAATTLNLIATIGLSLSLVAGILGMNVLVDAGPMPVVLQEKTSLKSAASWDWSHLPLVLNTLTMVLGLSAVGLLLLPKEKGSLLGKAGKGLVVAAILAGVGWAVSSLWRYAP